MKRTSAKAGSPRPRAGTNVPQRTSRGRPEKQRLLIVGEGKETEPNYFRGLRDEDDIKARFAITVKGGTGGSPMEVVKQACVLAQQAKNRGEDYDEVWCILDVEAQHERDFSEVMHFAQEQGIGLCLSNPVFEVWLLAHFERTAQHFQDYDAVRARLNSHWQKEFGQDCQKNDERIYERLRSRTDSAIDNARWVLENHHQLERSLEANSSTEVYRLVGKLKGL